MLEGNLPQCSIYLLYNYNILDACLKLPLGIDSLSDQSLINQEIRNSIKLVKFGAFLLEEKFTHEKLIFLKEETGNLNFNNEKISEIFKDFKRSINLALLSYKFKSYSKKQGKEVVNGAKLIYKESLKLSNDLIREITVFSTSVEDIIAFVNGDNDTILKRLSNAKLIRKIKNPYFIKSILLAIAVENLDFFNSLLAKKCSEEKFIFDDYFIEQFSINENINSKQAYYASEKLFGNEFALINENYFRILEKYNNWVEYLIKENLLEIDNLKPIFDGVSIQKILGIKAGKELGIIMESLIEHQIVHANLTEDEAVEFLYKKKNEICKK